MIKQNSLLKNTAFLMLGQLLRRFISFFSSLLIARTLGPEKFGQYNYVITLLTILSLFWEFGLNTLLTKDVSREPSTAAIHCGNHILLKNILMIIGSLFVVLYLLVVPEPEVVVWSIILFTLTSFLTNINGVWYGIFRAYRRMDYVAFLPALFSALILIFLLIAFRYSQDVSTVFACQLGARVIVIILSTLFMMKFLKVVPKIHFNLTPLKKLFIDAIPFFMTTAVNIVLFRIDHIMLSKIVGDFELGLYSANYTIFEVIIALFPITIMGAAFPILSTLYSDSLSRMQDLFRLLLKYFILISIPMGCGMVLLGREIIVAIYGKEYFSGGFIFSILGYSIPIFFMTQLISWTLTAADRQKIVFTSSLISMLLNIGLNFYMIKVYGAKGAALSTIACEAVQLIFMGYYLRDLVNLRIEPYLFVTALATIVMAGFIVGVRYLSFDTYKLIVLIPVIILSIIIYYLIVIPSGIFKINELKRLFNA